MTEHEKESRNLLERMKMFNDAVYAIVLTLLVLELHVPEYASCKTAADMWHCMQEMSPKLFAFLLSIVLVGGNWISSVNIQSVQVRADKKYPIHMVTYLSLISLAPFTCNIIGSYPDNPMSYVIFGVLVFLVVFNAVVYMRHLRIKKLYHEDVDMNEIRKTEKSLPYILAFIAFMAGVAFLSTTLSFCLFLIFSLLPFFITQKLRINHKDAS